MLNNIRTGNGKAAIQELLQQCSRPLLEQNGVKPTQLFSRNADVDTVNAEELRALQGEEVCSPAPCRESFRGAAALVACLHLQLSLPLC